jgi:type II secretory pathway component GspD/PulD (secretin)
MKAYSQTTELTLNFKNAPVKQVLNEIEAKTTYHFLFNDQDVDVNRKVSLTDTKQDINNILFQLFKGTDIVFRIEGKQIVLTKHKPEALLIKGTVKDEKGEPVIGASVVIQGTAQGTITDVNGNFSLTAPANATLNVAYIGYETVKMPVEGKTRLFLFLRCYEK